MGNNKKNNSQILKLNHMYKIALLLHDTEIQKNIIKNMISIARKFLVKTPTSIKRTLCFNCFSLKNGESKIIKEGCGKNKKYLLNKRNRLSLKISKINLKN